MCMLCIEKRNQEKEKKIFNFKKKIDEELLKLKLTAHEKYQCAARELALFAHSNGGAML